MRHETVNPDLVEDLFNPTTHSPEDIVVLAGALDDAWAEILTIWPFLGLLGPTGGLTRRRIALGIVEGAKAGICTRADLAAFALEAFPKFRLSSRNGA